MNTTFIVLAVLFVLGLLIGIYARIAPKPAAVQRPSAEPVTEQPGNAGADWTAQAGAEFSGLSESARCDLLFAVSDLDDERSQQLLEHALDDPSDAVALAAAHALARRGRGSTVNEYAQHHPGERAQRIVETLALLD